MRKHEKVYENRLMREKDSNRKIKIVYILHSLAFGGIETFVINLVKQLDLNPRPNKAI